MSNETTPSYQHTLLLPRTDFSMRANALEREPLQRAQWEAASVRTRFFAHEAELPTFILHDGPPYANGDMHIGHALNKVLKDMTIRAKRMAGYNVSFIPGWDCHGLPIELKVVGQEGAASASRSELISHCRTYAASWIATQEESLRRIGIWAEWENKYLTMAPDYEGSIVESFGVLYEKGFIERKHKTVPWCPSCQTVLATAEIEYADRKDPSCYILFPLSTSDQEKYFSEYAVSEISLLIWTTTPWTIPLNRAVVLHPSATYHLVQIDEKRACIVGDAGLSLFTENTILGQFSSDFFTGITLNHPLTGRITPIIFDESVVLTEGTACVHSAPGCGPEDYVLGIKNNLEIYSPISPAGTYTADIIPAELAGKPVSDGQGYVMAKLIESGHLLSKQSITHSYPHCWRCRNGLIFRATQQWFCNLTHKDLQKKAVAALETISFVPAWGKQRLTAFVGTRPEWCVSRQRTWGIPIPALLNKETGAAYTSGIFIKYVAHQIAQAGIEWWDTVSLDSLLDLPVSPVPQVILEKERPLLVKEYDILDVWFDAGVSHTAVMEKRGFKLPVDLYLEGSDQHRGWFQSATLTSLILHDKMPMKTIMTHGFIVDAKGYKMSKSRGNGISPQEICTKYGSDVLRLWVASVDYERDVALSEGLLTQTTELYRKLRNTLRFLLANLVEFNQATDTIPFDKLRTIDRYASERISELNEEAQVLYAQHKYAALCSLLGTFSSSFLSALYFDMCKDTLYVAHKESHVRKSVQTVLAFALTVMTRLIAPILVYTAEDVYAHTPLLKQNDSIHLERFIPARTGGVAQAQWWEILHTMRTITLRAIEQKRASGELKHSLEAAVIISIDPTSSWASEYADFCLWLKQNNETEQEFLRDWYIVSSCTRRPVSPESELFYTDNELRGFAVSVSHAEGAKCPRCWHWSDDRHEDNLCTRCIKVLTQLERE